LPRSNQWGILEITRPIITVRTPTEDAGDAIRIEQLEVFACIGVPDEERSQSQRLTISITFWPKRHGPELGDDIGRTVNYAAVCAETKKFMQSRSDRLIETLADALANHLLDRFEIRRITIELRKFILPDVQFVSVTVTRDRSTQ
jgi:dihydroneopterin aldolase